ncbi:hypothetical protein SAMN02982922_2329 [Mesorhizobium australicum]|uniref:Uncharacterized protein n=1 Tax=Mesorhizobium australicum TaxID=536018 RepID=A0A1X7NTA8_9HYPH|nr:hypothetical protein SAMN02982922_2329 [Mesorhizobium australicum]
MILYVYDAVSHLPVFMLREDKVFDLETNIAVFDIRKDEWFIHNKLAFPTCLQKGTQVYVQPNLERPAYYVREPSAENPLPNASI